MTDDIDPHTIDNINNNIVNNNSGNDIFIKTAKNNDTTALMQASL